MNSTDEIRCPRCGKMFIPAPLHVYKDDKGIYCSWSCYNKTPPKKVRKKRPSRPVNQYEKSGVFVQSFSDAVEAANTGIGSPEEIRKACNKNTPYKGYLWRYADDLPPLRK